jgi:hypothetical protein
MQRTSPLNYRGQDALLFAISLKNKERLDGAKG